ncbi:response regulator transcription factor [Vibrio parahaemolyticus]|nr:response regulator transcription factor [Vibrio parahaemolyticus]
MKNDKGKICLIVDPRPISSLTLSEIISELGVFDEILISEDIYEAKEMLSKSGSRIDLLLIEVNLKSNSGFEILSSKSISDYSIKTIFLSESYSNLYSCISREIGANAYISKFDKLVTIQRSISAVINDYTVFKSCKNPNLSKFKFTISEAIILHKLVYGSSINDISKSLNLSFNVVYNLKKKILGKFGESSLSSLIRNQS